jgi:CheY-like chemotaxis protein
MGGDVGVQSQPGQGSRFWFRLRAKLVSTDSRRSERPTSPVVEVSTTPQSLCGRVLVVEDNLVNCLVIESLLGQLGLTVTLVNDGQQALNNIIQGTQVDVILMDLHMPIMDGYTATEQIRQWESEHQQPHLPIIALTADAFEEDRQHCMAVGMNDFLTKPIAIEALKSALSKWLPKQISQNQTQT